MGQVYMGKNENILKIFTYALNQEEVMKSFFQTSCKSMTFNTATRAFERLIEDEEKHIQELRRIIQGLQSGPEWDRGSAKRLKFRARSYFNRKAKTRFLEECRRGSSAPDVCIFNTAWVMEKEISEFYGRMAEQSEGEARKILLLLAEWERGHEAFFRDYHDRLSEFYSRVYK